MINISTYTKALSSLFPEGLSLSPWELTGNAPKLILEMMSNLSPEYRIKNNMAIHPSAHIEENVVLKAPLILSAHCFIGSHAYLRGGVFLGEKSSIGPGCEVKSSWIMPHSAFAHFNFVGDSIIGSHVNLEAGAIVANHYNERSDRMIHLLYEGKRLSTGTEKFGALIGDHSKIGANAVLSPGTLLIPGSIVKRLELIEQA